MEFVLWRNTNVLLDVELFHARTWAFAFPEIAQFSLYSLFCGSLVTQNVFIEKEKILQRMQSFPRHLVLFPLFCGGEWKTCMFGVFTAGFSGERI